MNPEFFATWKLERSKNSGVVELAKKSGFNDKAIESMVNAQYTYSIRQDGDTYHVIVDYVNDALDHDYAMKVGEPYTPNEKSRVTLSLDRDGNPVETIEFLKTNITWTVHRTVKGDTLTAETTCGDAIMTQTLMKQ